MRIESTGKYEYRKDLYDEAAEAIGESTWSKGLDASAKFTKRTVTRLERAVQYKDMTEELSELHSTPQVEVVYGIETGVAVENRDEAPDLH